MRNIKAHQAAIWAIAYDPSGKRIATASWDQTAKVWDAEQPQGRELFPNRGGYSGCFSPDSRYLIRGGTRLEVIEVGTHHAPHVIPDYQTSDIAIAVAPDGSILASAGTDQIVTLWEMGTWRRLAQLQAHTDKIWQLAFSPDGRTLASGDPEVVRLWDVARRVERAAIPADTRGIGPLLFTPDGRMLITSSPRRSVFRDATTGRELRGLDDITRCVAVSPDGKYLLGESSSGLNLLELNTMETKWCVSPHRANTCEVKFSPDGRTVATASWDGTAKLWNVASGQEMFTYKTPAVAWSTTFVTEANAGNYRVAVTNPLGSVTSSNAILTVIQVHEAPILEISFEDQEPSLSYAAFTYSENPAALSTNIIVGPGLGVGGSAGLMMTTRT